MASEDRQILTFPLVTQVIVVATGDDTVDAIHGLRHWSISQKQGIKGKTERAQATQMQPGRRVTGCHLILGIANAVHVFRETISGLVVLADVELIAGSDIQPMGVGELFPKIVLGRQISAEIESFHAVQHCPASTQEAEVDHSAPPSPTRAIISSMDIAQGLSSLGSVTSTRFTEPSL